MLRSQSFNLERVAVDSAVLGGFLISKRSRWLWLDLDKNTQQSTRSARVHLQLPEDKPHSYITSDPYPSSCGRTSDLNVDLLTHSCKWDSAQSTTSVRDTCVRLVVKTIAGDHIG